MVSGEKFYFGILLEHKSEHKTNDEILQKTQDSARILLHWGIPADVIVESLNLTEDQVAKL